MKAFRPLAFETHADTVNRHRLFAQRDVHCRQAVVRRRVEAVEEVQDEPPAVAILLLEERRLRRLRHQCGQMPGIDGLRETSELVRILELPEKLAEPRAHRGQSITAVTCA